jgi:hypothetical protein
MSGSKHSKPRRAWTLNFDVATDAEGHLPNKASADNGHDRPHVRRFLRDSLGDVFFLTNAIVLLGCLLTMETINWTDINEFAPAAGGGSIMVMIIGVLLQCSWST